MSIDKFNSMVGPRLKEAGFGLSITELLALYDATSEPFFSFGSDALIQWHPAIIKLARLYRTNYRRLREADKRGSAYVRLVVRHECRCLGSLDRKVVGTRVLLEAFEDTTRLAFPIFRCQESPCRWQIAIVPMDAPRLPVSPAFSHWMDGVLGRIPDVTTAEEWQSLVEQASIEMQGNIVHGGDESGY